MTTFLRIILPVYLVAFFVVAFLWRSYLVWKRTGVNPYSVGRGNRVVDFIEHIYPYPLILILLTTVVFAAYPPFYAYTVPIEFLEILPVKIVGLALMGFALCWTAVAQMQMGASWRIGIDTENTTDLVGVGLFRVSRNPIFLGMRLALFGYFLVLPNAVTLVAVVLADVLMQIQVRLEEEFLMSRHGAEYTEYCGRVRRWI